MERINNLDIGMSESRRKLGKDKTGITGYKEPIPANWKYKPSSATWTGGTKLFMAVAVVTNCTVLTLAHLGAAGL
jgi:hypothetical protein